MDSIEERMRNEIEMWRLNDQHVNEFLFNTEQYIRSKRPNCKLLFSTDNQHKTTHVAVYDFPLVLNGRHNFNSALQYAPQLIGKRFDYQDEYDSKAKLKIQLEAWESAFVHLYKLEHS